MSPHYRLPAAPPPVLWLKISSVLGPKLAGRPCRVPMPKSRRLPAMQGPTVLQKI